MLNLLTDIPGLIVGHATDLALGSGVTAILFDEPATASVSILGGAPGSRDTALLEPEMTALRVDGFALGGGSCFGLDAAGGVQAWAREQKRGAVFGGVQVPVIPQAIVFDLTNGGNKDWGRFSPYREMGYAACEAATRGAFALGTVGGGTGATTPLVKGGLGSASAETRAGYRVAAITIANPVGNPLVGKGPHFWAAPFEQGDEFGAQGFPAHPLSVEDLKLRAKGIQDEVDPPTATSIGLIVTDAPLSKAQAKRLAIAAQDGLARAVHGAHLPFDGDTMFAAATGQGEAVTPQVLTLLCHAAMMVTARSIARGVYQATALPYPGALPSWRDLFR
ncbi:P1 family peptidase [Acidisoma cellulosilytica]|uniref:P1 family peptidase n=1 Tax=Acidisoma cellulosilyticum TaxID=2802395 RepID=A0A964E1Y8_9PROT|nr:P1 family peptidase [Acidisoma cellulosilyticum]MCB8879030.1 P1 family peptidase [Acidisoma cellulosilyticum]